MKLLRNRKKGGEETRRLGQFRGRFWNGGDTFHLLTRKVMEHQRNFGKLSLGTVGFGDCGLCRVERGKESPEFCGRQISVTVVDRLGTWVGSRRPLLLLSHSPSTVSPLPHSQAQEAKALLLELCTVPRSAPHRASRLVGVCGWEQCGRRNHHPIPCSI